MKIGIIGAGNLGTGLAEQLRNRGHDIRLSFSRDPDKLQATARALNLSAGTAAEAAAFAEVVIFAMPWVAVEEAVVQVAAAVRRKILWDCTNPLQPDLSGLLLGTTTSGGEELARLAPGARVVKAIPPFAELLHSSTTLIGGAHPMVFVCSDDEAARQVVAGLVADIGAEPIAAGGLATARYTEPAGMLAVQLAYRQGLGPRIGLALLREPAAGQPHSDPKQP